MKLKNAFLPLILSILSAYTAIAQQDSVTYPEIGKPCPNLPLHNISHYRVDETSTDQLRGQWLILDFWNKYCSSCVASFPRIDSLQKKYRDRVQYFLIGREDPENEIREVYARFQARYQLNLSTIFDSSLQNRLDIGPCPYIILIDPKGTVKAITSELSDNTLNAFMQGENPRFKKTYRNNESGLMMYDINKPLFFDRNGGDPDEFLYRCILTKWNSTMKQSVPADIESFARISHQTKFEASGLTLSQLYFFAYFGKGYFMFTDSEYNYISSAPILEIQNDSLFKNNFPTEKNIFSCSILAPSQSRTKENLMHLLQQELKQVFGYNVSIESRKMPYWRLVLDSLHPNKVKSLNKPVKNAHFVQHTTLAPYGSTAEIIGYMWNYNQTAPPFIDETGYTGKVYFAEQAMMSDLNEVRRALKKNGFDLIKGEKNMQVLVIRDRPGSLTKTSPGN